VSGAERLLGRLEGVRRSGKGWTARCPAHEDRQPSLSIAEGEDGRLLLHCFAGCPVERVVAAVGLELRDLFPEDGRAGPLWAAEAPARASRELHPQPTRPPGGSARPGFAEEEPRRSRDALLSSAQALARLSELRGWTREAIEKLGLGLDGERILFPLRDATGALVGIGRYQPNPDKRAAGKLIVDGGSRRELFPRPEDVDEGEDFLWLTEGEPDAIVACSIGLPAVAVPGVQGWRREWCERFRGRRIIVCFDCDAAGREASERVARDLAGVASEVRVLDLSPQRDDGYDLSGLVLAGLCDRRDPEALAQGRGLLLDLAAEAEIVEPPKAQDGAALLDELVRFLRRFVVLSEAQAHAIALWVLHTHAFEAASTTPYLNVSSAEKESGKTRLLEVLRLLVAKPWFTGRASAAALTRKIAKEAPTLLLDESDTAFKGEREYAEALRGILNAGYRKGGNASVCVKAGGDWDVRDFPVFCPKAIAGIGELPDTVASRSIPIRLKRRAPSESVQDFFEDEAEEAAAPLRGRLEWWAKAALPTLKGARPLFPAGLRDRTAECSRPLLAIADSADGDWPRRARGAAVELLAGKREDGSIRVRLLADIRRVRDRLGGECVFTRDLIRELAADEEGPWSEWWDHDNRGPAKGAQKRLGGMVGARGVTRSRTVWIEGERAKGYRWQDFDDAFSRYLPEDHPSDPSDPSERLNQAVLQGSRMGQDTPSLTDSGESANPHGYPVLTDLTDSEPEDGKTEFGEAT
jgi:Protein of unknown function (DUF3631)/Toprim-like